MNIYIASYSGTDIAHVNAVDDLHQCVMTTVDTWLQAGLTVTLRRDTPVVAVPTVAPKPVIAPKPAPKQPIKAKPAKMPTAKHTHYVRVDSLPDCKWSTGDAAYMKWSVLPVETKTHLSQYRMVRGIVSEFRCGNGVTKQVGIKFNGDPECVWFRVNELTDSPEVD